MGVETVSHGVAWSPKYDLRMHSQEGQLQVHYHGEVSQSTGEDWRDVCLVLSTATPSIGGDAPEPEPWHLHVTEPRMSFKSKSGRSQARTQGTAYAWPPPGPAPALVDTLPRAAAGLGMAQHVNTMSPM